MMDWLRETLVVCALGIVLLAVAMGVLLLVGRVLGWLA
jgi:hypothetical protein